MSETSGENGSADPSALLMLVESIEQLSAARTAEDVAAIVRTRARAISGADGVSIVLRDGDFCHYLDEDAVGPLWKGRRFPIDRCISGWAMTHGETVVIPDVYADARIPHDAYGATFVKSLVMTPVRPDDPVGAIGAYWSTVRQPSPDEVSALSVIARATATALRNVALLHSLEAALAQRDKLIRELDHRVKNTLAAALSIANQTLRTTASPTAFTEAFNGRLMALSQAHELMALEGWRGGGLEDVLRRAIPPDDLARVSLRGPAVRLKPESAVSFLLVAHELATNALRHGALTRADGRVSVDWRLDGDGFALSWRERGGPTVQAPARPGFGVRMIEHGLPRDIGGKGVLTFAPEGVRYDLSAPPSERIVAA